jgi:hypothetical protein
MAARDDRSRNESCADCGKSGSLLTHGVSLKRVCRRCYFRRWLQEPLEQCSNCGQLKRTRMRVSARRLLCARCSRAIGRCASCGSGGSLRRNCVSGEFMCARCSNAWYDKRNRKKCSKCHQMRHFRKRPGFGDLICGLCRRREREKSIPTCMKCCKCGELREVAAGRKSGQPLCGRCYEAARLLDRSLHEKCLRCERVSAVHRRTPWGRSICFNCYQRARKHDPATHETCSSCGRKGPVAKRNGRGKPTCFSCYGFEYRKKVKLLVRKPPRPSVKLGKANS